MNTARPTAGFGCQGWRGLLRGSVFGTSISFSSDTFQYTRAAIPRSQKVPSTAGRRFYIVSPASAGSVPHIRSHLHAWTAVS